MNYKPYLAGFGFATIFGFSFMFTRGALEHIAPFHLLGLRFAVAAVTLTLLQLVGLVRIRVNLTDVKAMLPLVFFLPILYFPTETIGVQLTSASHAGMMIAVIPICVTILSALLLKEYPTRFQLPFVLATVGGVIFISLMQSQGGVSNQLLGTIALLGAVVASSCYNIASRHAASRYSPFQRTWVMMVIGAVVFNSVALIQHVVAGEVTHYFQPLPQVWPAILYLGILSSVVAFFFINYSLSHITAIQSSVFANLVTVIAILAGVFILGEDFFWFHAIGAAAILAGVWGTNRFAPSAIAEATEQKQASSVSQRDGSFDSF